MARRASIDGTPSDEELVRLALAGSAEAYRGLVERFQRPVLSLIARMVGDLSLAEDLAQESFVRAFDRLHTFDGGRKFSSWLFKIAHNRTLDHLRLKKPDTVALEPTGGDGESFEVLEAPAETGPHRRAESAQLAETIDAALGAMRENYRAILVLRFQGGLRYQEIADATGLSMAAVKVQLHRARKQLAKELRARGVEAPEAFRG
ncbi:MAG: sigma-70 family RNA polymerase sigma factor [Acidobacteriota bacterium]